MQTLRFCFFCQPLSSFSFLRVLLVRGLPGIQWCLLVAHRASADADRRRPVAAARAALPLDLRRRPTQARTDLVCLDLDDRPLVAILRLPGPHLQAAGDDDARPAREGLSNVLG